MKEFIYRSNAGRIHFSLRTRGPQTVKQLAAWLKLPVEAVYKAVLLDGRIGWNGYPVSDVENVKCRLVTKEAVNATPHH